jgi:hypothetical protein
LHRRNIGFAVMAGLAVLFWSWTTPSASVRPSFIFDPPQPWRKVSMPATEAAWAIREDAAKPTLTVGFEAGNEEYDLKALSEEEFVSMLEKARAIPYRIFGILAWKAESHRVLAYSGGFYLEMTGSYLSPGGSLVRFVERDHFVGTFSYAVIYSENAVSDRSFDASKARSLLDGFRPSLADK